MRNLDVLIDNMKNDNDCIVGYTLDEVENWMLRAARAATKDMEIQLKRDMNVARNQWKAMPWWWRLFI